MCCRLYIPASRTDSLNSYMARFRLRGQPGAQPRGNPRGHPYERAARGEGIVPSRPEALVGSISESAFQRLLGPNMHAPALVSYRFFVSCSWNYYAKIYDVVMIFIEIQMSWSDLSSQRLHIWYCSMGSLVTDYGDGIVLYRDGWSV